MRRASCARPISTSARGCPPINPTVAPRINPNIAARRQYRHARSRWRQRDHATATDRRAVDAVRMRASRPTSNPACQNASRGADGECSVARSSTGGGKAARPRTRPRRAKGGARQGQFAGRGQSAHRSATNSSPRSTGRCPRPQADELARRHGLERIASQNFPLLGGTIGLFRIIDRRPVETVRRELAADGSVRSVQLNFRYFLQDQKKAPTEGDPAQYAVAQLRLPQAHRSPAA